MKNSRSSQEQTTYGILTGRRPEKMGKAIMIVVVHCESKCCGTWPPTTALSI